MKIIQGRDLSSRLLTDIDTNVLVNEAMVKKMGWTEPLGQRVAMGVNVGRVVGVVEGLQHSSRCTHRSNRCC